MEFFSILWEEPFFTGMLITGLVGFLLGTKMKKHSQ